MSCNNSFENVHLILITRSALGTNKSQYRNRIPADNKPDDDTTFSKIAVNIEVGLQ